MATRITVLVTDDELYNLKYRALLLRAPVSELVRPRIADLLAPVEASEPKKEGEAAQ